MIYREIIGQIKREYEGTPEEILTLFKATRTKEESGEEDNE